MKECLKNLNGNVARWHAKQSYRTCGTVLGILANTKRTCSNLPLETKRILIDQFLELRRKRFQSELEPMRMS